MFPVFHKVDVVAELETLLPNGRFVLAWPVQVAWEGLRVARKKEWMLLGEFLWELHRTADSASQAGKICEKEKAATWASGPCVGGSVVLLGAWPPSPSMPVRGTGVRTRAGCLTSQVSKPPYSRACECEGLVTAVHNSCFGEEGISGN